MKIKSMLVFVLLFGLFGFRQETAYSFVACPAMAISAQVPMASCCGTHACRCAAQKNPQGGFGFLAAPDVFGKQIEVARNPVSIHPQAPAAHKNLPKNSPKNPSFPEDKLYELYSDYRI